MDLNRPENLKQTGNLNDNFKLFKQEVEVYFVATETNTKSKDVQVARLLNLLGADGLNYKILSKLMMSLLKIYLITLKNTVSPVTKMKLWNTISILHENKVKTNHLISIKLTYES